MTATDSARRLVERHGAHPVLSLYLDLEPDEFATAPARGTEITSLTDDAERRVNADESLEHDDLVALREDVERVRLYLLSDEPPFQGARALAVFSSVRDDLFEVVAMTRPATPQVVIDRKPFIGPLIVAASRGRWAVALVSRADARILTGTPERLRERVRQDDDVHGQHTQGGWSQARYQRSVEEDASNHLRTVADDLFRLWQRSAFDRLALGGPTEAVARFEELLHGDLRPLLVPGRVSVDVSVASEDEIRAAVEAVVEKADRAHERAALDRLAAGLGSGGRAAGGLDGTLAALAERRVAVLLLAGDWDAPGGRCPSCGLLTAASSGSCPADGTAIEPVASLREAMTEAALLQDSEVLPVTRYPDLGPHRRVAALLRF